MSILIKGMEMPKSCASCDIACRHYLDFGADGLLSKICQTETRRPDCPLIPGPPHGRLIEESKVLDIVSEWCPDDDGSVGKVGDLREMLDEIEALPTIIPAEEGEP